jgi:hypothetical protein
MMWVLTGDLKYRKDSQSLGASLTNQRKIEDAERIKEGLRPLKRRRNKKSHNHKRPDKSFTQKRRAAQFSFSLNGMNLQV